MSQRNKYLISFSLQKSLPKKGKEYLAMIDEQFFPVVIYDPEYRIRYVNQVFTEVSGVKPDDLIDGEIEKIFEDKNYTLIRKALKSGNIRSYETNLKGKRGKSVRAIMNSRAFRYSGENSLMEIIFQVTESLAKDAAHEKFEDLQILSGTGYFEIDPSRKKFSGSAHCFVLTGHEPAGIISFAEFLSWLSRKEDCETIEKGLIGITNTNNSFQAVVKLKKKSDVGSENNFLRFLAIWSPKPGKGKYKGILQDITQTKKIEKELLKAKLKAEKSDRIKSNFLTNLSYEIRTPMNAILGFTELLNLEELTVEQKLDYTRIISQKGNSLLSLIDDAIELSQFETGIIDINKSEFDLYPLLRELYEEFDLKRIHSGKTNVNLELKISEDSMGDRIYTDPGRLQQLLSNLLSNAIKYTEKGSIEYGYKKDGNFIKFYVKDTGIGIDEEEQNLIFNRFKVIEETSGRKYSGGGLSLTISKHIVELLGGKIKVKSEVNKGSRFQIIIPLETPPRNINDRKEFEEINTLNWKDKVILIAEDEDVNYRFLEAVLQKTQVKVLRALTGKDAVELCRNISKIDLVLMDIKMPVKNGFEATREIKKIRPSLPIIAQTAFASADEIIKCQIAGCDEIITKPIDIIYLLRKINEQIQ